RVGWPRTQLAKSETICRGSPDRSRALSRIAVGSDDDSIRVPGPCDSEECRTSDTSRDARRVLRGCRSLDDAASVADRGSRAGGGRRLAGRSALDRQRRGVLYYIKYLTL